jgi:hypothetical protein
VEEVIPGAETRPEDLPAERRKLLEPFAHLGRFFFGRICLLSPDGRTVLAELRSFPGDDETTRTQSGAKLLAMANDVLAGKSIGPEAAPRFGPKKDGPPFKGGPLFKKDGPFLKKDGFGPKKSGPRIGDPAPDFQLKLLDAQETFRLSDNFGRRPTVLIFHSFT